MGVNDITQKECNVIREEGQKRNSRVRKTFKEHAEGGRDAAET